MQTEAVPVERRSWLRRGKLLQPMLRVMAEASWITVVYAALAVIVSKHAPYLGPVEFIGFVLVGVFVARVGRDREEVGPILLIFAVVIGGAVGWLASDEARGALNSFERALSIHLAGWFAGVAVVRGAVMNTGEKAADDIERLLRNVPPALAVIWAYMIIAARGDLWVPFAISALWGTVGFLSTAVVSIGFARLDILHAGVRDKAQRRGWRWLVTAVGVGIVPLAIPIGILSGIPLSHMLTPIGGPLQWALTLLAIPLAFIVEVLSWLLRPVAEKLGVFLDELAQNLARRPIAEPGEPMLVGTIFGLALWAAAIFFTLLAIFMVARWLLRRKSLYGEDMDAIAADTERSIVVPDTPRRAESRPRFRRRGAPQDAVQAYLSALDEYQGHLDLARLPSETPAQHAARLRASADPSSVDLARLAADYQLARYAERPINRFENLRALTRFQRLKRLLKASST